MVFRILFLVGILWKWILWSSYFWKYYTLCSHLEKSVNGSILNSDRIQHNFINQIFPRPSWLCAFFISSLLFIASWTTQVLKIILRYLRLPWWLDGKKSACDVGDLGSIPGLGRSPGGEHGNPHQYSCLENPLPTEEPGGLQTMGLQRVGHDWATNTYLPSFHWFVHECVMEFCATCSHVWIPNLQ